MRTLPDKITTLQLPGGQVEVDEAGFLIEPSAWTPEFAKETAKRGDLELTDLHWKVLAFMRSYLDERGIAADARYTIKFLERELELNKPDAKAQLFELFPKGYVEQPCKISGMRQPRAWSTG